MAKKAAAKTDQVKKSKTAKKAKKAKTAKTRTAKRPRPADARKADGAGASPSAMKPPPGGAIVRMYRIGHGDCFLVAFEGERPEKPAYMLIDCGYKPGSPGMLTQPTKVNEIGAHIIATTGGFVDVGIVTHEH